MEIVKVLTVMDKLQKEKGDKPLTFGDLFRHYNIGKTK